MKRILAFLLLFIFILLPLTSLPVAAEEGTEACCPILKGC